MTPKTVIICEWCGDILGEAEHEAHAICNKCLDLRFPNLADLIRSTLEVERIEEIFVD